MGCCNIVNPITIKITSNRTFNPISVIAAVDGSSLNTEFSEYSRVVADHTVRSTARSAGECWDASTKIVNITDTSSTGGSRVVGGFR